MTDGCITYCKTNECTSDDSFDCYYEELNVQPSSFNDLNCTVKSDSYDNYTVALHSLDDHNINNKYSCYYEHNFITKKCNAVWNTIDAKYVQNGATVGLVIVIGYVLFIILIVCIINWYIYK